MLQLMGMALASLEAHHRNTSGRVHSTAEGRVPSATCRGPQENKTATMEQVARAFLSTGSKTCGASAACTAVRRVTEPPPSPKWQREPTTGFAMLATDEAGPDLWWIGFSSLRRLPTHSHTCG